MRSEELWDHRIRRLERDPAKLNHSGIQGIKRVLRRSQTYLELIVLSPKKFGSLFIKKVFSVTGTKLLRNPDYRRICRIDYVGMIGMLSLTAPIEY